MAERIAHGEVEISVNDGDALARLRKIEAEFEHTMRDLSRQKAEATIDAEIAPFEDAVKNVKREIKVLEGEKATTEIDAEKRGFDKKIRAAKKELRDLEGQKAEVELRFKAHEAEFRAAKKRLDEIKREIKQIEAEQKRAAAEAAAAEKKRLADVNRRARVSKSLRDQEAREEAALARENTKNEADRLRQINTRARVARSLMQQRQREEAAAHSEAIRMDRERDKAIHDQTVGYEKQTLQIIRLQRQYGKLTDRAEYLAKQRKYTVEGRAKLELDKAQTFAEMRALKAELNRMGAEPPVDIKVDLDRSLAGRGMNLLRMLGDKASGLGDVTARLGPFTASIKQIGLALSFLGPTIVDLVGSVGALIGVIGSGISGAAAVGSAGLVGLGAGFLGLKFALRNAGQEFTNVRTYINAYQKAVEKYGENSDKAKAKQEELNHALKTVSPLARESALGIEKFYKTWDKHTASTQRSAGVIAKGLFHAMNAIAPMWARSTNMLAQNLETSLGGAFKFMEGPEFKRNFTAITDNFNAMVPTLMHALGSFGRGFLNFAREGSKALGPMADGIDGLADKFLKFTQRDDFGATVKRWVSDARAIIHLFGSATSVLVHFFSAGRSAGRGLVDSMDQTLQKWDSFLQSDRGRGQMADAFNRAADGARALWHALAPIAGAFLVWASNLSPFVSGLLTGFGWVMKIVGGLTKMLGLGGPLAALGATIGAAFAIGKIGAFIAGISRLVGLLNDAKKAAGGLGILKTIFSGATWKTAFGKGGGMAGQIEAASAAGAAEFRAGIISGGAAAAAEMRAAMGLGGAAGGIAGAADDVVGGIAGGRSRGAAKGVSTVAREAEGGAKSLAKFAAGGVAAEGAIAAVGAAGIAATAGVAALAVGAGYLGYKLLTSKSAAEQAREAYKNAQKSSADAATQYRGMTNAATGVATSQLQASMSLKEARRQLRETKKGTDEHRMAMLNYRQAWLDNKSATDGWKKAVNDAETVAAKQIKGTYDAVQAFDKQNKSLKERMKYEAEYGRDAAHREAAQNTLNKLAEKRASLVDAQNRAENRAAATAANYARIYRGLVPLLGAAEQQMGKLARSAPKIAKTVAVKFTDSGDAGRVAAQASRALNSGVPKRIVTKIVADSKNADQAIARLNAARITPKKLAIAEQGGAAAVQMLQRIIGKKLTPKQQRIAEQGGPAVLAMLGRIIGRNIPNKSFLVKAIDQASGIVSNVQRYIAGLHDKTITIRAQHIGPLAGRASGGSALTGSPAVSPGTQRLQDRAIERVARGTAASTSTSALARGARIQGPRAVYGEEPQHPEFVISTNPRYRKSNQGFLRNAAQALGIRMAAGGFNPNFGLGGLMSGPDSGFGSPVASVGLGGVKGSAMRVSKKVRKRISKGNRSKGKHGKKLTMLGTNHPWLNRVNVLEEQQGLWEREVQFREGNVQEPDDFLNEIKDDKGNVTGYTIDEKAVAAFTAQLQSVKAAYDSLVKVIQDLLTAIPRAYNEANNEIANRTFNIGQLNSAIAQQNKLIRGYKKNNKNGKYDDEIKRAEGRVKRYTKQLGDEKQGRDAAKTAKGDLIDKNQTAAFDYKDAVRDQGSYNDQIAAMNLKDPNSRPNTALAEANANLSDSGSGGSGGSSSDPGLSYGSQAMMADTEKASVLKQFGSNFNPNVGGFGAGAAAGAGAGQNMVGNLAAAAFGSVAAGGRVMSAMTAMAGGTSAARSVTGFAGGGSAGGAVSSGGGLVSGGSTVTVNNTFATVPPDPHTWSKGVQFELGALV